MRGLSFQRRCFQSRCLHHQANLSKLAQNLCISQRLTQPQSAHHPGAALLRARCDGVLTILPSTRPQAQHKRSAREAVIRSFHQADTGGVVSWYGLSPGSKPRHGAIYLLPVKNLRARSYVHLSRPRQESPAPAARRRDHRQGSSGDFSEYGAGHLRGYCRPLWHQSEATISSIRASDKR